MTRDANGLRRRDSEGFFRVRLWLSVDEGRAFPYEKRMDHDKE